MSGSPFSNNVSQDGCDPCPDGARAGVPNSACPPPSCLKPACPAPVPQQQPQQQPVPRTVVQASANKSMSSIFINNGASASAPPADLAGSSSNIGASLIAGLSRERRVVERSFEFTAELPFGTAEAATTSAYQHVVDQTLLKQTLGGEYDGKEVNPKKGMLVSFKVTAHNDSQFPVALSFPNLAEVEAHRIGADSAHSGAMTLKPGQTKTRELIVDEAIIDDHGVTNIAAFNIDQLKKCETEGGRGEWEVYARMKMPDGTYRINPVLEEMNQAGKISADLWEFIGNAGALTKVQVDKDMYDEHKEGIVAQHRAVGERLTDLTNFVCVVERADGKNFAEMPSKLLKCKGEIGDRLRDEFRAIPSEVHCDVELEYASDAIASQ